MLAQGNALGYGIDGVLRALKGRVILALPFQGERCYWASIPGALPRADMLRAVGAKP
jgi:hypothetical protein